MPAEEKLQETTLIVINTITANDSRGVSVCWILCVVSSFTSYIHRCHGIIILDMEASAVIIHSLIE